MSVYLTSLTQHCCKPLFWSQVSRGLVFTLHRSSWSLNSRSVNPPAGISCAGVLGVSGRQKNLRELCHKAFSGAGVTDALSRKQSVVGVAARMTTTVNASQQGSIPEPEMYMFGQWKIDTREVFLITEHCYCFVNIRPVVPEEVTDLWLTAQRVGQKLEPFFNASSLTLAIQDGPEAGQTVPHVHVHVLPRKRKDFENNDEIYEELDRKEKELNEAKKEEKPMNLDEMRKDRNRQEMFDEASELRALFQ